MEKIKFPPDFAERAERSVEQAKKYGAACIWCGYATKNTAGKVKRGITLIIAQMLQKS
jgi:hypothetical protein